MNLRLLFSLSFISTPPVESTCRFSNNFTYTFFWQIVYYKDVRLQMMMNFIPWIYGWIRTLILVFLISVWWLWTGKMMVLLKNQIIVSWQIPFCNPSMPLMSAFLISVTQNQTDTTYSKFNHEILTIHSFKSLELTFCIIIIYFLQSKNDKLQIQGK